MKTIGFGLLFVALAFGSASQGCAKAADTGGTSEGEGGFGGGVGGSVAEGPGPSTSGVGGDPSTSGATTAAGTTTATTSASGTTTSSSTTSTSAASSSAASTSASTGSGMMCPAGQHLCGGICAGNTIQTGCFGSNNCVPCPAAPVNGTSICSGNGTCDFTCSANHVKQGNACVCASACCSDADCGGGGSVCSGGACTVVAPACDGAACTSGCFASCLFQGKVGIGTCINDACVCVCA